MGRLGCVLGVYVKWTSPPWIEARSSRAAWISLSLFISDLLDRFLPQERAAGRGEGDPTPLSRVSTSMLSCPSTYTIFIVVQRREVRWENAEMQKCKNVEKNGKLRNRENTSSKALHEKPTEIFIVLKRLHIINFIVIQFYMHVYYE